MSYQQYQSQYYQQQPQQTQTQGLYWNGSAWVSPSSSSSAGGSGGVTDTSESSPVELYTRYYHGWQAFLKEYQHAIAGGTADQNHQDWARYYSDQSSRAAHYYYEQLNQYGSGNAHRIPPPPFDLPPAPPSVSSSITLGQGARGSAAPAAAAVKVPVAVATPAASATQGAAGGSTMDARTPGTLTQYVQRCLNQCTTAEQRVQIQGKVEKVIAHAIQHGNLHTKNWNAEPLISLPGMLNNGGGAATVVSSYASVVNNNSSNNNNTSRMNDDHHHHHRLQATSPSPSSTNYYGHNNSAGDNYYGPASAMNTTTTTTTTSTNPSYTPPYQRQQQQSSPYSSSAPLSYYSPQVTEDYISLSSSSSIKKKKRPLSQSPSNSSRKKSNNHKSPKSNNNNNKKVKTAINALAHDVGLDRSSHALAKRQERFGQKRRRRNSNDTSSTSSYYHPYQNDNDDNNDDDDQIMDYGKYMGISTIGNTAHTAQPLTEEDFEHMTVKGTCQILEKEYLRLTAPPKAELVRPQPILERHLNNLRDEYYGSSNDGDGSSSSSSSSNRKHDYLWFCSQLKAVRQDLTIQRIQNRFAVDVYETHARIALMEGDLNEFNQCQTQLKELYNLLLVEENDEDEDGRKNEGEFVAYRLLYHVLLVMTNANYQGGTSEITQLLGKILHGQKWMEEHPLIQHALQVRECVASMDYFRFFQLHHRTLKLGKYLTERMVPTMRLRALKRIVKVYRPFIDLEVCLNQFLGFGETPGKDTKNDNDVTKMQDHYFQQGREWVESCGAKVSTKSDDDNTIVLLTKESDGLIHEPKDKVKNSLLS